MLGGEVALSPHIDLTDRTSSHHSATVPDPSATEGPSNYAFANSVSIESRKLVNMVLNVHRNHKAYRGRGEWGEGGMEVREEGDYIPIATLTPPE